MASDILVYFLWHGKQWHFTSFHLEIILQLQWVLELTFETYVPQGAFNWKMAKKGKQIGNWKIHFSWKEGTVANLSRCNQTGKKLSGGFDHPRNELPVSAELFSPTARRGTTNEKKWEEEELVTILNHVRNLIARKVSAENSPRGRIHFSWKHWLLLRNSQGLPTRTTCSIYLSAISMHPAALSLLATRSS